MRLGKRHGHTSGTSRHRSRSAPPSKPKTQQPTRGAAHHTPPNKLPSQPKHATPTYHHHTHTAGQQKTHHPAGGFHHHQMQTGQGGQNPSAQEAHNNRMAAHANLTAQGMVPVGYHGSTMHASQSMVNHGLDPTKIGSGSGTEKGHGFYVTPNARFAADYAKAATQAGDPSPETGWKVPKYPGNQGVAQVNTVYAPATTHARAHYGVDSAFGIMSSDGDPNGDKMARAGDTSHADLRRNKATEEAVYAPHLMSQMAVLPGYTAQPVQQRPYGTENYAEPGPHSYQPGFTYQGGATHHNGAVYHQPQNQNASVFGQVRSDWEAMQAALAQAEKNGGWG